MGFDLYGKEPKNEKGEYFRNNVWWWRPLWNYVGEICGLRKDQIKKGHYNDGLLIDKETAERIALMLKKEIDHGNVKKYEEQYMRALEEMPDEECDLCGGSGVRNDEVFKGTCNKCGGKGKVRPFETLYPFSEENVKEFAEFCENSGGFEIW
jgi:hypothetical protein